ncbi:hypothetical protein OG373_02785 [Streptomyces avidinii]|uniref:hypothetical protein n=1 Tax=Streptomyces avidinii TaxID=1895 RepID=UPI0038661608|nr:hypothetical protein OG373_02785 [Streptomyces avidinii]
MANRWVRAFDRITRFNAPLSDVEAALAIMKWQVRQQADRRFEPRVRLSRARLRRPEAVLESARGQEQVVRQILPRHSRAA